MFLIPSHKNPLRQIKRLDRGWTILVRIRPLGGRKMARHSWTRARSGIRYREHPTRKHGVLPDRYYTLYYKVDGRMVQEALGWASDGWTLKAAEAELAELKQNQRRGLGPRTLKEKRAVQEAERRAKEAQALTVAEFWEKDYVHNLKARTKESSSDREIREFRLRIKPIIGNKELRTLTNADVERIIDKMKADHLSPRSQEYLRGTISRLWKHAALRKLVKAGDNPATGVKLPKVNNTRLRVLSGPEFKSILDHLAGLEISDHDLTIFCALTGCRFSEAARLKWEHIDFSRSRSLFPETKNRESREVHLADPIIEMLHRRGPGSPGMHVFLNGKGEPYTEPPWKFRTVVEALELNKERDKRDRVSFHTLRHTAATIAARQGTPLKDLQEMFGWKTPSMVFRYAKGDEAVQKQAVEGIAQALTGEPAKVLPLRRKKKVPHDS